MHAGAREGIITGKSGGIISRYASLLVKRLGTIYGFWLSHKSHATTSTLHAPSRQCAALYVHVYAIDHLQLRGNSIELCDDLASSQLSCWTTGRPRPVL